MKDKIDRLIEERAPWLFRQTLLSRAARRILDGMLRYDETIALGQSLKDLPASAIMDAMAEKIALDVTVCGLEHIPRTGPALIVSNHPTGIADGVMLWAAIRSIRPDLFYFANKDICRVLPTMDNIIAPVEWQQEKRSHGKTRETMIFTRNAVKDGRLGVIFPSGRLAKRRGLRLHERPWMASAAMIARRFDLPVVPINIQARNSALFYTFDLIHPTLRDITLFNETLNKDSQPFKIIIGEPISPAALPDTSEAGIALLKRTTLGLGERHSAGISLVDVTPRPTWLSVRA